MKDYMDEEVKEALSRAINRRLVNAENVTEIHTAITRLEEDCHSYLEKTRRFIIPLKK